MNIDSIENGVVLDHISQGKGMLVVKLLGLEDFDSPIAIIRNARTKRGSGKKDIIKIEGDVDMNLDVLGFVDPKITVNIIVNGSIAEKKRIAPPNHITNVVKCKNPRCITSIESELPHVFQKSNDEIYRCIYCEEEYQK